MVTAKMNFEYELRTVCRPDLWSQPKPSNMSATSCHDMYGMSSHLWYHDTTLPFLLTLKKQSWPTNEVHNDGTIRTFL